MSFFVGKHRANKYTWLFIWRDLKTLTILRIGLKLLLKSHKKH